eukprot:335652-Karenia_brevis.AAC.1
MGPLSAVWAHTCELLSAGTALMEPSVQEPPLLSTAPAACCSRTLTSGTVSYTHLRAHETLSDL